MADISAFDNLANAIQVLDSMGLEVVADTHIHEKQVAGEKRIVADIEIVLDGDGPKNIDTGVETPLRRMVRQEVERTERELQRGSNA